MKKLLLIPFLLILLAACGGTSSENQSKDNEEVKETSTNKELTVDEYVSRIEKALNEMGDKTNLKIISNEENEDKRQVITLSENIFIFIEKKGDKVKQVNLAATTNALLTEKEDLDFAFLLLVGTVDDTLVYKDRYEVVRELGLSDDNTNIMDHLKVVNKNKVRYTFKGDNKSLILQAEFK